MFCIALFASTMSIHAGPIGTDSMPKKATPIVSESVWEPSPIASESSRELAIIEKADLFAIPVSYTHLTLPTKRIV